MALLRVILGLLFSRAGFQLLRMLGGPLLLALSSLLRNGGLRALLGRARTGGLGPKADTWVSRGENELLSPEEVDRLIAPGTMEGLAAQAGLPEDEVRRRLTRGLPAVVDRVTPDGEVPDDATIDRRLDRLGGRRRRD